MSIISPEQMDSPVFGGGAGSGEGVPLLSKEWWEEIGDNVEDFFEGVGEWISHDPSRHSSLGVDPYLAAYYDQPGTTTSVTIPIENGEVSMFSVANENLEGSGVQINNNGE